MPTRSTNATPAVYAPSPPAATCPARSPSTRAWPGNSNWAFYRYDTALVALIGINQRAFTQAIATIQDSASGWTGLIPAIAVVAVLLLTYAGTRSRLSGYR